MGLGLIPGQYATILNYSHEFSNPRFPARLQHALILLFLCPMENLKTTLKEQIIESLNLEGMKPEDIDDNAPLFGEGLGLDSIDSLELMVLLERNYGIKIEDARDGRKVLTSVQSMADYIEANKKA